MAEFCNHCARDHGFAEGDFKGVGNPACLPLKPGEGFPVICEGCGYVLVDNDGWCLGGEECTEEHHLRPRDPSDAQEKTWRDRMRERQRAARGELRRGQEPPKPTHKDQ